MTRQMDLREVPDAPFRRHPWEVARARFFASVLRDAGWLAAPRAVLDVGAGDGFLARQLLQPLPAGSRVVCFDREYRDQDLAHLSDSSPPEMTFTRVRPPGTFDLVLLLDVVEHVADDGMFLEEVLDQSLAPGGAVLVSVPAWQGLFSAHDEALGHHRRYRPSAARHLLEQVGLVVLRSGGVFHSLLLPRLFTVARERAARRLGRTPKAPPDLGDWRAGAAASAMVGGLLAVDNALSRGAARLGLELPGLSWWALAGRPGGEGGP